MPDLTRLRRPATAAVVFDSEGRILLHRRSDNGKWALPGGNIDMGETADQCVVREVKEETGYDVKVEKLVGVYSDPVLNTITYPDGNVASYVSVLFECSVTGGKAEISDESTAVDWFAPDALPEPFQPGHVPRVKDAVVRVQTAFYR